jgi:hypothetical protein
MLGKVLILAVAAALLLTETGRADSAPIPNFVNYQGRIIRGGTNYDGTAQFKFKFINAAGTVAYWSNDGSNHGDTEPATAVSIPVTRGLFYVKLGDTNIPNMQPLSPEVFTNSDVRLRIWVDSGSGSELITPDQVMASVGYAMMSANIPEGVVTPGKLASETRGLFVPTAGGTMSGALTNMSGYYGSGGELSNMVLNVAADRFSVGSSQLTVVSNRVGIGTASPRSVLEVAGPDIQGEVLFRVYSGTNVVAWARKK